MTINSNVTIPDINQQKDKEVKFTIPGDWITSGTKMMKRCDHIGSQFVELDRRCRAMITEIELLIEGIEQVSRTVPTYEIEEEKEENETNDRM
ncbi:MAG TPA: hypothetical protein VLG09_01860 [Candidatus Saccharimonadales bacterium]|nr:hypothetical protein [Candidatus Saccharimonadales bacterium]